MDMTVVQIKARFWARLEHQDWKGSASVSKILDGAAHISGV